jgi:hypothetical protein
MILDLSNKFDLEDSKGNVREYVTEEFSVTEGLQIAGKVTKFFSSIQNEQGIDLSKMNTEEFTNLVPLVLKYTQFCSTNGQEDLTPQFINTHFKREYALLKKLVMEVIEYNGFLDLFELGNILLLLEAHTLVNNLMLKAQEVDKRGEAVIIDNILNQKLSPVEQEKSN